MGKRKEEAMCDSLRILIDEAVQKELRRRAKEAERQAAAAAKKAERQAAAAAKRAERLIAAAAKKAYDDAMVYCLLKVLQNSGRSLKSAMNLLGVPRNMRSRYGKLVKAARAAQTGETKAW